MPIRIYCRPNDPASLYNIVRKSLQRERNIYTFKAQNFKYEGELQQYHFGGGFYNGSWVKNRREGKGSLKLENGTEFKGTF
jgi:hypothetical protein